PDARATIVAPDPALARLLATRKTIAPADAVAYVTFQLIAQRRPAQLSYAWRVGGREPGPAQRWWLERLANPRTQNALIGIN
ncbi:MAG: hypothetical protein ACKOAC_08350, partial [Fluviibacter sp.]